MKILSNNAYEVALLKAKSLGHYEGFELGIKQKEHEYQESLGAAETEMIKEGLRLPRETIVFVVERKGKEEIVALNGKWKRMPDDGETLKAYYKGEHERFRNL